MKKFSIIFVTFVVVLGWLTPVLVSAQAGETGKLKILMENTTPQQRAHF